MERVVRHMMMIRTARHVVGRVGCRAYRRALSLFVSRRHFSAHEAPKTTAPITTTTVGGAGAATVLFRTASSGINAFRAYGVIAYSLFGVGLYVAPQLLAEHDWAPLWLRSAVAGLVVMLGGGLIPLYAMYLKRNIFQVAVEDANTLALTTLSPLLLGTRQERLPLDRVHPEPRQGKWLRIIVRDAVHGERKLTTLYLERTGQFVQYRTLESIVKTGRIS